MTTEAMVVNESEGQYFERNPPIMRAAITKSNLLGFIDGIAALTDEVKVSITSGGMSVHTVDPAHISMLIAKLDTCAFESYEVDAEGPIGFDAKRLKDILKFAKKKGDVVEISTARTPKGWGKLVVKVGGMEQTIDLMNPAVFPDPRVPQVTLPTSFILDVDTVRRYIDNARKVSDWMAIDVSLEGVRLSATHEQKGAVKLEIAPNDLVRLDCPERMKARTLIPLAYMKMIVGAMKFHKYMDVEVGTDIPIRMKSVSSHLNPPLTMSYLLAPRVENDR